ncbi:hypothetical protein BHE74_00037710 [Ensete ventricosum]|nr:hypothetical protein BHE74_00037710 [Ensete ventricosum]
MRSRVPYLAARIHGVSRPGDRQLPRGEEATTLPTPELPIAEAVVALSMPDLPGEEAAALPCLKSLIPEAIAILPRLESPIAEATTVLPRLNSPQNDRRGDIAQGSNRPPLPAHRSVRKEVAVPSADRKRKRKQSTSARESCHFALGEAPKGEASSPHTTPRALSILGKVSFRSIFNPPS